MNVKVENIKVEINGNSFLANLKWYRGASRYNNGGNHGEIEYVAHSMLIPKYVIPCN